ncbi:copper resistance CopC family protein [Homoserinibacter sp. YIM 151385]|uniref:copper resistance CopC family protein n=1 Tax=Homoserinibacter sp. YIM 151385 TaxID=2985506 RepID=UPI0022EFE244|nr:copper resistance CopC family protein [Homoserinibacter sp. YIM 151385]WBU39019.1 copper resistance protein CopC [Homoserinibacter sp. YIM 151385]
MTPRLGRPGAAVAAAALVAASVLLPAGAAQAHNYIVESTPAEDGTLTELPERFAITTNEGLLDVSGTGAGFAIQIRDAEGSYYGDGCIAVQGTGMSTPAALGEAGDYELLYQFVSADGHTVSGEYAFAFQPDGEWTPSEGSPTAPDCGGTAGGEAPGADEGSGGESGDAGEADGSPDVALGDILWIGGAVLAVLVAAGVTLLVLSRRKPAPPAG